ncbi:sn-glycerol-3-phosphate ABC transporter ATP-binding protein UgpC [Paenibacillus sp. ATY16]|uniref:ABC transporter ATP-binding protein n=1 Tax=Paenibacillus sp. ATY16 TaxID=1759312 RepID=UPI00200CE92C|nr:sn-glycerol-3-phosphate ABC transporter ATP-binding protein UgpC [Paenibacillus sp. ATY16]MCK9862143.1 sn-glycerol-3-phosphate ABC transporter ATP-binding protein UgpC [Paenibacillus sp. ATY16]
MSRISFKHVFKYYGKHQVVTDFNLEIESSEFVVFVGPSGCGKSTTLRMIAGLEDISQGEIHIGDRLINHLSPKDRDIAMVFQNYALYPNMSVYENIAFGLRLRKTPKHEIDLGVKKISRVLGIESYLGRKPKQLSGGQRQRVALGRAIVREPQVFLMDEPLSNLDAQLRVHMRSEIVKLQKQLGVTMVYVTHDQTEAMTMGSRIVVMKDGLIQQVATPEEIYNKPANKFVAGFIGSPPMNFIEGRVVEENGRLQFRTKRFMLELSREQEDTMRSNNRVNKVIELGVRPENISIEQPNPDSFPSSSVTGTLLHSELMGADRYLHLNIGSKNNLIVRVNPFHRYEEDTPIQVTINMSKALFFDVDSGVCY